MLYLVTACTYDDPAAITQQTASTMAHLQRLIDLMIAQLSPDYLVISIVREVPKSQIGLDMRA